MSLQPRTALEEATSLTDFSASRLGLAGKCGLAFEYRYIRKLPAPFDRSATLFGTAVHDGVEIWYGPDGSQQHRELELAPIILAQWERLLPPVIWQKVLRMRDLDAECEALAEAIVLLRGNKAPRQTKVFLESSINKEFVEAKTEMLAFCDKLAEVKWPKDEDPYTAYKRSAEIGKNIQRRWRRQPRPIVVEWPFAIEIAGFRVRGRIDQLRQDLDLQGQLREPRIRDMKTGRQPLTQMEAFLQAFLYYKAVEQAPELPTTTRVDFYLARHDKYQDGRIDPARMERLASRILNGRARQITQGQFEPSYGPWCKQCDFEDVCSTEVGLWQGDGLAVEVH